MYAINILTSEITIIRKMICNEAINRYLFIKFDYIMEMIQLREHKLVDIMQINAGCTGRVKLSFIICFFVCHSLSQS